MWRSMLLRLGSDFFGFPLGHRGMFRGASLGTSIRFLFWLFDRSSRGGAFGSLSLLLWGTRFRNSTLVLIYRRRGLAGRNGPVAEFPAVKCAEQPSPILCLQIQDIGQRLGACKLKTETPIAVGDVHDEPVQRGTAPPCRIEKIVRHFHHKSMPSFSLLVRTITRKRGSHRAGMLRAGPLYPALYMKYGCLAIATARGPAAPCSTSADRTANS